MADKIAYLLILRFKMGFRLMKKLGWLRSSMGFIAGMALLVQLVMLGKPTMPWMSAFLGGTILSATHFKRQDILFLRSINSRYRYLMIGEYLLVIAPLIVLLCYQFYFWAALVLIAFAMTLPFVYRKETGRPKKSRSPIRYPAFFMNSYEWVSGFRKNGIGIVILLLAGILLSFVHYVAVMSVIFIMTAVTASFYAQNEPRRFITLIAESPSSFLLQKIISGLALYTVTTSVLWLTGLALYPELYLYASLFWLMNIMLLMVTIASKYAFFEERKNMELPLSTIFIIALILLVIPYLQFAVLLMVCYLWMRAVRRLNIKVYA